MKIAVFSSKPFDKRFLRAVNQDEGFNHELKFFEPRLDTDTAVLARSAPCVCAFVNDDLSRPTLEALADEGVRLVALRSAGFNHVDLNAAADLDIRVVRVPAYSPQAVAEHALGLILALNRKIHRAYMRVREGNLALDGLLGFNLHGKTVGIVGTGRIGIATARILRGFGCLLLGYDVKPNDTARELGVTYVPLDEMFACADVLTLHAPLTPETHHMINHDSLALMKHGMMLVNTSRGALVDTRDVIDALKAGTIGALALDVYEEEENLFFEDLSNQVIKDDVFARLLTFPNVLITGHQAFFTREALTSISETTLANVAAFEHGETLQNEVSAETHAVHA